PLSNPGGAFASPEVVLSTDFGYFDRWTFAIGLITPSAVGNRSYGLTDAGLPSPGRYDLVSENLLIVYPRLAAAVRVTRWLEIGAAVHLVVADIHLESASVLPLGTTACP